MVKMIKSLRKRALSDGAISTSMASVSGQLQESVTNVMGVVYDLNQRVDKQQYVVEEIVQQLSAVRAEQSNANTTANCVLASLTEVLQTLRESQMNTQGAVMETEQMVSQQQKDLKQVRIDQEQQALDQRHIVGHQKLTADELWNQKMSLEEMRKINTNWKVREEQQGKLPYENRRRSAPVGAQGPAMCDATEMRRGENEPSSGSNDHGRAYRNARSCPPDTSRISPTHDRVENELTREERGASTVAYQQITPAPEFNLERYEDWKKSMTWWQELNMGTDQNRLLATVGIAANPVVKGILQDYFESTKQEKSRRSVDAFMAVMDSRFRRPMEELVMIRIQQWNEMQKNRMRALLNFGLDSIVYVVDCSASEYHGLRR